MREVLAQDATGVDLGRPVRRAVVVGQVEVGDAEVECRAQGRPLRGQRLVVAEVVPQAQGDEREQQAAVAAASHRHAPVIALRIGLVLIENGHAVILAWPPYRLSSSSRSRVSEVRTVARSVVYQNGGRLARSARP